MLMPNSKAQGLCRNRKARQYFNCITPEEALPPNDRHPDTQEVQRKIFSFTLWEIPVFILHILAIILSSFLVCWSLYVKVSLRSSMEAE